MSARHQAILYSYRVLGLCVGAASTEIRDAYRSLVKIWHPDVFQGETSTAEARIKAINEAFSLLKKATPRELRAAQASQRSETLRQSQRQASPTTARSEARATGSKPRVAHAEPRRQPRSTTVHPIVHTAVAGRRGRDLLGEAELTRSEAVLGARWKLVLPTCRSCGGWGIDLATALEPCVACRGLGFLDVSRNDSLGFSPCPWCGGHGCHRETLCKTCGGAGSSTVYTVWFTVPAGIGRNFCGRVDGLGHPGVGGAPPGDLYLVVV